MATMEDAMIALHDGHRGDVVKVEVTEAGPVTIRRTKKGYRLTVDNSPPAESIDLRARRGQIQPDIGQE